MREEFVEAWMRTHPVLKNFDSNKMPNSPNPLYLIKLIPDSFSANLLVKPLKIVFDEKMLFQPCRVDPEKHEIKISPRGYDYFIRALGLYAWHHLLNADQRNTYASFVGARNITYLFHEQKGTPDAENSTAAHFARNVQNVITLRPLEFASHKEGAARCLLLFFKSIGIIDDQHHRIYNKELKSKRAYLADSLEKIREEIEKYPVTPNEVKKLLKIIVPLELEKEKKKKRPGF